jgi:hypothetical protein
MQQWLARVSRVMEYLAGRHYAEQAADNPSYRKQIAERICAALSGDG